MEMRVERIETHPQPIVALLIVVPALAIGNGAIQRHVSIEVGKFRDSEARFHLFQSHFVERLLPPVETIMDPQSGSGQLTPVRE